MGKRRMKSLLPLLLLLFVAATPDGKPLIALVGDSITQGVINDATLEIPDTVPPKNRVCWQELCFAEQLRAVLTETKLVNLGLGGATSRDWEPNDFNTNDAHFIFNTSAYGSHELFRNIPVANVVFFYIGTNDAVGFLESGIISAEDFELYLADFRKTLKKRGVEHVILVTSPIAPTRQENAAGQRQREYNQAIRRICKNKGRGGAKKVLIRP